MVCGDGVEYRRHDGEIKAILSLDGREMNGRRCSVNGMDKAFQVHATQIVDGQNLRDMNDSNEKIRL